MRHPQAARSPGTSLDHAYSLDSSTIGPTAFGELRRQVEGISSRVLTERLRGLEQKGIVYREYEPTIPPAVTYGITKRMKEIKQVLGELNRLAETWQNEDGAHPHQARG